MIKRPTNKDSENEILRMQQEFYAEQNRDVNFQPAAKVVRVQRDDEKPASIGNVRQSEFAKRRAQRLQASTAPEPVEAMCTEDEPTEATPEEPTTESLVMGEVVERIPEKIFHGSDATAPGEGSFPKTLHITTYPGVKSNATEQKKSIFAQMISKGKGDASQPRNSSERKDKIEFEEATGSALLEGWDATEIHNDNMRKLNQMSIEEINKERNHLLNTLDPKLVEFLKARKKPSTDTSVKDPVVEKQRTEGKKCSNPALVPAGMEVLKEKGSEQWINFDVLEPEKLEWTKDIERSVKELNPGESYEARFDWKGVLQPYVAGSSNPEQSRTDDRELYLHGDDAERPGYTLQELFRLARSNVLQQRISALGAIAGMLNIMNQGFYDGVLELPVSKVFFFLRFALDENTPSVVEVASRALASLFYNDTDEILLDTLFDSEYGMIQPELALNITHSHEEERHQQQQRIAASFGAMNLTGDSSRAPRKAHFKANLPDPDDPDDVHNRETMNDFHLAETDLIECLARTNILERIRYILFAMKPEGATVINCTKVLIRLARNSEPMALKIATNEALIGGLVKNYLTSIECSDREHQPQHVVLKLMRILCGYRHDFYQQYLNRFHVVNLVKRYVFSRKDIDVNMIQIQIEAFRFFRLLLQCKPVDEFYSELWPALCYLLEWHYQHLIFDEDGPFIIRQHAVALLALIGPGLQQHHRDADATASRGASAHLPPQLGEKLFACCSKWFTAAIRNGANEFSQKMLLAGCLWTVSRAHDGIFGTETYTAFLTKYLTPFVRSERFGEIIQTLSSSSLVLTHFEDRTEYGIASLPSLGAVQVRRYQTIPTLIVTRSYPVFLLHALLHLLLEDGHSTSPAAAELKEHIFGSTSHRHYLQAVCARTRSSNDDRRSGGAVSLIGNWFVQTIEQRYLLDVLQLVLVEGRGKRTTELPQDPDSVALRTIGLQLAFFLTYSLSEAFYPALVQLFDDIIFVPGYYTDSVREQLSITEADMQRWKLNYKLLAQKAIQNEVNLTPVREGFTVTEWKSSLLRRSWPYSPLYLMVDKLEKGMPTLELLTETAIISTGLWFSELVEASGISIATPTERLMYLMAAFLGPDSKFLEPDLSVLIERRLVALRSQTTTGDNVFDFERAKIENRKSYYGLYQLALDTFQSSSYGHGGFGCLLMVPLAQKYDVRWRNMVWSEYVAVLRFITCNEHELFGEMAQYLEPAESDTVLLRSYGQALNSNLLRPGSIPHRIAHHHLQAYRAKVKVMPASDGGKRQDAALMKGNGESIGCDK
ncbi:RNA polymerase II-associated protein 1 [Anopheles maculipalpis]|uniref:RNA polymerase II-associated protein 1 n=1 Tax=Anopheles maculipalpis TaxID=1496333 RepID=UPI002158B97E|nr:RNA polymerase II-associated protein 1 [Anopheles maculipalpis]